jgi:hypothetical protein
MTNHDITEIADARFMVLMCPPASPEAKELVADIFVRTVVLPRG